MHLLDFNYHESFNLRGLIAFATVLYTMGGYRYYDNRPQAEREKRL